MRFACNHIGCFFFILNFFIWGQASSGAIPFGTMVALLLMWFGISVPLVFVGAFFGFKAKLKDPPTRTNEIPRQIPEQAPRPSRPGCRTCDARGSMPGALAVCRKAQ